LSNTLKQIIATDTALSRMERQLALQKVKQRKAETRRKIELGGLVVKSEIDQYPKSVVLGALLDAIDTINQDPKHLEILKQKGEMAFLEKTSKEKI
jgi:hypothetical protein|tara:strand:+ start:579 stop:866 length:288 start_codon:yes stop_codon:yes gene_type:complete